MRSRKVVLFIIALVAIIVLTFFNKDVASIVALYGAYCAGNVVQKGVSYVGRNEVSSQ